MARLKGWGATRISPWRAPLKPPEDVIRRVYEQPTKSSRSKRKDTQESVIKEDGHQESR